MASSVPVLATLILSILIVACTGSEPTATQTPRIVPPPTATPTPAPTIAVLPPSPTPLPTATATPTLLVPTSTVTLPKAIPILTPVPLVPIEIIPGEELTWLDVTDHLDPLELNCVKRIENSLDIQVAPFGAGITLEDVRRFACLEPNIARSLLVAAWLYKFHDDTNRGLPEDEVSCLKDLVFRFDPVSAVESLVNDSHNTSIQAEFLLGVYRCIPSVLAPTDPSESEEERKQSIDCVRRAYAGLRVEIYEAMINQEGYDPFPKDVAFEIAAFTRDYGKCFGYVLTEEGLQLREEDENENRSDGK